MAASLKLLYYYIYLLNIYYKTTTIHIFPHAKIPKKDYYDDKTIVIYTYKILKNKVGFMR